MTGEEYAFILRHYRAYCGTGQFLEPTIAGHPEVVYDNPTNGMIYFIKGWHIREFGFPRADNKKKLFKWKKMNFTTDLPKNDPICTYLVATGKVEDECYRMHVVINFNEYSKEYRKSDVLYRLKKDYIAEDKQFRSKLLPQDRDTTTERIILCHIIKVKDEKLKRI